MASIRRAAFASCVRAAASRKSAADKSTRVIVNRTGFAGGWFS
jgi:hypothetical protein